MAQPDFAILVYGGEAATKAIVDSLPPGQASEGIVVHGIPGGEGRGRGEPIILVAIGEDGWAAVARLVEQDEGLGRVVGIVFVGPVAPWALRPPSWLCEACQRAGNTAGCGCEVSALAPVSCGTESYLPLGPLGPLHAWAQGGGEVCIKCGGGGEVVATLIPLRTEPCRACDEGFTRRPLLVITAHPDAETCRSCGGRCSVMGFDEGADCHTCNGAGGALGSKMIAEDLLAPGETLPVPAPGTNEVIDVGPFLRIAMFPSRAAHDVEALPLALSLAMGDR